MIKGRNHSDLLPPSWFKFLSIIVHDIKDVNKYTTVIIIDFQLHFKFTDIIDNAYIKNILPEIIILGLEIVS